MSGHVAKAAARGRSRALQRVRDPVEGWRCGRGLLKPGFDHYVGLVREGREFALLRRAHGFWDRLVDLADVVPDVHAAVAAARAGGPPVDERVVDGLSQEQKRALEQRNVFKGFWESDGYAADLIRDLQHPHRDEAYIEAVQFCPGVNPSHRLRDVYLAFHTSKRTFHDGLVWRRAVREGRFADLVTALRPYHVVVVGPPHTASFGEVVKLPTFSHVGIHPTLAFSERHETVERIRSAVLASPSTTVVLFQAASLASWLIYRLWEAGRPRVMLDVGRAIDIWYPAEIRRQDWFKRHGSRMVAKMGLEDLYRE